MGYVPGYILSASASPDGWPEKARHVGGQEANLLHIPPLDVFPNKVSTFSRSIMCSPLYTDNFTVDNMCTG